MQKAIDFLTSKVDSYENVMSREQPKRHSFEGQLVFLKR